MKKETKMSNTQESQLTTIYRIAKGSSLEELQAEVNRILGTKPHRWGLSTGQILIFYEEGSLVYTREMIGYFPPEDIAYTTLPTIQEPSLF